MAQRPVFIPSVEGEVFVKTIYVDFDWSPGLAASQKKKSIASLHKAAIDASLVTSPLEVSSKSDELIGVALSAFNLSSLTLKSNRPFTVETLFQSSKVFEFGGPFRDLLNVSSREAKKDERLFSSGRLIEFDFYGEKWPLEPRTAFYDWLYIQVLLKNPDLMAELMRYDGFTDIEFNPKKSINCQAYTVALFKSLSLRNKIGLQLREKDVFLSLVKGSVVNNASEDNFTQPSLL